MPTVKIDVRSPSLEQTGGFIELRSQLMLSEISTVMGKELVASEEPVAGGDEHDD